MLKEKAFYQINTEYRYIKMWIVTEYRHFIGRLFLIIKFLINLSVRVTKYKYIKMWIVYSFVCISGNSMSYKVN